LRVQLDKHNGGYDQAMTSPSREEVDAKLNTVEAKVDGRLASFELALSSGVSSLKADMDAQFARFEASLQKTQADTIKWVVGIVLLLGTLGLAIMTFLFNNMTTKVPLAAPPIVITIPSPPYSPPDNSSPGGTSPPQKQSR
jgi:hypothetical protein